MPSKKSARILALVLALIMIGSIAAFGIRGIGQPPKRVIKHEAKTLPEIINILPDGATQVLYMDLLGTHDKNLLNYTSMLIQQNTIPEFFRSLQLTSAVRKYVIAAYPDGLIYLLDVNKTKTYYLTKEKTEYLGYTIKISYDNIAFCDQVSPIVLGTPNKVLNLIECINNLKPSFNKSVGNYTSRIGKNYPISLVLYGESAKEMSQNTSDFYFIGYGMNGTLYEKFVALHFTEYAGFVESNVTEFYSFENYKDGFSIASMSDSNFTKVLEAKPEIRLLKVVKIEKEKEITQK